MKPFTHSPTHVLRSVYLRLHRIANRVFLPYGVTADQYVLMQILTERDGISQQELAKASASDATTVGRMLELLEQRKFIARRAQRSDRRTRLVHLTAKGRKIVAELYVVAQPLCGTPGKVLSENRLATLHETLTKLSNALQEFEIGLTSTSNGK